MKEKIKNLVKKYLGEMMVIVGTGLFVYNILDFSYRTYGKVVSPGILPELPSLGPVEELEGIAYYYSYNTLWWISISAMLIVSGILIIRNKKLNERKN